MKRLHQNRAKSAAKSKSQKTLDKESKESDSKQQSKSVSTTEGTRTLAEPVRETSDNERPASPDPNCSICLCKMDDKSFTNSCFHMFCFTCLLEWSKVKAVCPLCKQSFKSIIHNIRSESDYDIYSLKADAAPAGTDTDDSLPPDLTMFEQERRPAYPWHNLVTPFEYLPQLFTAMSPTWLQFQGVLLSDSNQRRRIYHTRSRVREIQLPNGTDYRDISPDYFAANLDSDHIHQISVWLSRELAVLCPIQSHLYLKRLIMDLLVRFPIQSEDFYENLHRYFGDRTHIFVNELYNFARSPLSINDTDRLTVYDASTPTDVEVITLDRDDSDIEIISPPVDNAAGDSRSLRLDSPRSNSSDDTILMSPSMGQDVAFESIEVENQDSASPIAGPSGFLRRRNRLPPSGDDILCSSPEPLVEEIFDNESSSTSIYDNEIMFVGFDKPWRARTPISLSSDNSDIDVDDDLDNSLPVSSKTSPVSEELLELDLRAGNGSIHSKDSKRFGNGEDGSCSSTWSNPDSGELSERPNTKRLRSCYRNYHHTNSSLNDCSHQDDFGCSCSHTTNKSYRLQKSFDSCSFCENHLGSDQLDGGHNGEGQDGNCRFRKKKLKSRRSRSRRRMRAECQWALRRHLRKRRHEDCGDSGVAVDVRQGVQGVSDVAKVSYKKHFRGHKKSSRRIEAAVYSAEATPAIDETDNGTVALESGEKYCTCTADDVALETEHDAVSALSREASLHHDRGTNSNDPNEGEEDTPCEQGPDGMNSRVFPESVDIGECYGSPVSDVASKENPASPNWCANSDLHSSAESPNVESATNDSLPSKSESERPNICSKLDVISSLPEHPSIESIDIDSEDSVQWLDFERPNSDTEDDDQCTFTFMRSGRFARRSSSALDSDILQVLDDDDEYKDEESDGNSCGKYSDLSSKDHTDNDHVAYGSATTSSDFEDPSNTNNTETIDNVCVDADMGVNNDSQSLSNILKHSSDDLDEMKSEIKSNDFNNRINTQIASGKVDKATGDVKTDVNIVEHLNEITDKEDEKLSGDIFQEGSDDGDFTGRNIKISKNHDRHTPSITNGFLSSSDTSDFVFVENTERK